MVIWTDEHLLKESVNYAWLHIVNLETGVGLIDLVTSATVLVATSVLLLWLWSFGRRHWFALLLVLLLAAVGGGSVAAQGGDEHGPQIVMGFEIPNEPTASDAESLLLLMPETIVSYPDPEGRQKGVNALARLWLVVYENRNMTDFIGNEALYVAIDVYWYVLKNDPDVLVRREAVIALQLILNHVGAQADERLFEKIHEALAVAANDPTSEVQSALKAEAGGAGATLIYWILAILGGVAALGGAVFRWRVALLRLMRLIWKASADSDSGSSA